MTKKKHSKTKIDARRGTLFMMDPDEVVIVGLDTDDGPGHPLYDERVKLPLRQDRVLNFKTYGVLEPVNARVNGKKVEVTDGRQRVRYARAANELLRAEGEVEMVVPVLVKKGDDAYHFDVSVSANEHREDDGLLVKAAKLQRFLSRGRTRQEAQVVFGVSANTISTWLKILDLDGSVRKLVESGKMSPSSAAELAGLSREEQRVEAQRLVESGAASISQAARVARGARAGAPAEVSRVPGRKVLSRVVELAKDREVLPVEFLRGVRFAIGELDAGTVGGLTALVREAQAPKKKAEDVIDAEFEVDDQEGAE